MTALVGVAATAVADDFWRVAVGGDAGTLVAAVGQRIELVAVGDPATLRAGDTLTLEVRLEGLPASRLTVHAGFAGPADRQHAQVHVSDAAGRVRVPGSSAGSWYARTMHMRRVAEPPFEWEGVWASVTFPVR